ncbi:MAG TPA: tRNA glutamyl-Q(34) synthetase GluQRS [Caulobacteraceae bacterium]
MSPPAAGFVTRFAPSPSGHLHRGHAYSALLAADAATEAGGRFLLRIEDIDTARSRPEFVDAIFEDLAWLEIGWETPVVFQSRRSDAYARALAALRDKGLLYRCFRTRSEVIDEIGRAPHGPQAPFFSEPLEPAAETSRLSEGAPFAWRLSVRAAEAALGGFAGLTFHDQARGEIAADPWRAGDVVLARKDGGVAYHLAVTLDDAEAGVSCVIRGEDLIEACHVQRMLQALLGLPAPTYLHHRLILRPDGQRFAKRDTTETLRALREAGVTPARLRSWGCE